MPAAEADRRVREQLANAFTAIQDAVHEAKQQVEGAAGDARTSAERRLAALQALEERARKAVAEKAK